MPTADIAESAIEGRQWRFECIGLDTHKGGLCRTRLQQIFDYIESHIDDALSVEELAQVAGLSRYHFGKAFKASTNITIHQYVLSRRIRRARDLLSHGRQSLSEIAFAAGFPSQSHFTTVFLSRMGVTPAAYRNNREDKAEQVKTVRVRSRMTESSTYGNSRSS